MASDFDALRLAGLLEHEADAHGKTDYKHKAAAELRRLNSRLKELEAGKSGQAEAATASNAEQEELRAAQAVAVMPMIGPLLDAWEGLPNDISGDEELLTLKRQMSAISRAMDTAAPVTQPPAIPAAPAVQASGEWEHAENYKLIRRGQHWSVIDGMGNTLRGDDLDAAVDAIRARICAALASPPASGEKQG